MRAEVVCVGTELLLGDIPNTNAQEIGAMLAGIGVDCLIHVVVGDNEERIASALSDALARSDAVIVTGGLGPTQDDVTREAICRATGQRLVRDERLERRQREIFERLGRPMAAINLRQADRPEHAVVIDQKIGTAPGLAVEHANGVIYAVPGVPAEMREMMARFVLPDLASRSGVPAATLSRVVRVCGMSESGIAEALAGTWRSLEGGGVTMAYLAGGGEVRVRLTAKAATAELAAAMLDPVEASVRESLGAGVVGVDGDSLESVVGALLRRRDWTIGCAESLTAGAASSRLARVAGASAFFAGGVVAYAAGVKAGVLGVAPGLIDRAGIVSEDVALAMAAGVRERLGCDVGLGYTGAAGPDAHGGAAPGTVCIAVDGPLGAAARTVRLPGERETVITLAVASGLNLARLYLMEALT